MVSRLRTAVARPLMRHEQPDLRALTGLRLNDCFTAEKFQAFAYALQAKTSVLFGLDRFHVETFAAIADGYVDAGLVSLQRDLGFFYAGMFDNVKEQFAHNLI